MDDGYAGIDNLRDEGYLSISLPDVGELCHAKARSAPRPLGGVPIAGHRQRSGSQKQFDCNMFGVVSTAKQLQQNASLPQLTRQRSVPTQTPILDPADAWCVGGGGP